MKTNTNGERRLKGITMIPNHVTHRPICNSPKKFVLDTVSGRGARNAEARYEIDRLIRLIDSFIRLIQLIQSLFIQPDIYFRIFNHFEFESS